MITDSNFRFPQTYKQKQNILQLFMSGFPSRHSTFSGQSGHPLTLLFIILLQLVSNSGLLKRQALEKDTRIGINAKNKCQPSS